jgi:DNA-binding transcriptional LysR family regulator
MDFDINRIDWNHLRAFWATAETKSLSAAARKLGLTQPTLSRQVAALETELSLLLFERVGRGLQITEAGQELLAHVNDMGIAAQRAGLTASGQRFDLTGWVRITASDIMSAQVLPGLTRDLRAIAPQLKVEVIATNDISDLMRREADIAIRHMRPKEPDLVARMVLETTDYFYASKAMLDRVGRPQTTSDVVAMDWVAYGNIDRMIAYLTHMGLPLTPENFRVSSEDGLVAWEMGKAGLGVCAMEAATGDADPVMERLLPDELSVTYPVWLVAHREIHTSPKIRLVFDLLAKALAAR